MSFFFCTFFFFSSFFSSFAISAMKIPIAILECAALRRVPALWRGAASRGALGCSFPFFRHFGGVQLPVEHWGRIPSGDFRRGVGSARKKG